MTEQPLRGWKEVCGFMRVGRDKAEKILKEKKLFQKEGKSPVLLPSEYHNTLKPSQSDGKPRKP